MSDCVCVCAFVCVCACILISGVIDITWVWLITKIDDIMQTVTLQVRHMETTNREISTSYTSYSYTIALSGVFELYTKGGSLNHEAKQSGFNVRLECTIQ